MNRVKDYVRFATWFMGLGYVVLWPLTAHDNAIANLVALPMCGEETSGFAEQICYPPGALQLSPGLHLLGLMSLLLLLMRLLLRPLRRSLRLASGRTAPELAARIPAVLPRAPPPPRWTLGPRHPIVPRKDFGLRGAPH